MYPSPSKRAVALLGCGLLVCAAVSESLAETNILLVAAAPDHPWGSHMYHLNPVLDQAAKPLLSVQVDGQDHAVGWTYERASKGRSVGITLGHFHENFTRDDFRRLLVNAILWSAHVDIPLSGATVRVPADALELPPRHAEKEEP